MRKVVHIFTAAFVKLFTEVHNVLLGTAPFVVDHHYVFAGVAVVLVILIFIAQISVRKGAVDETAFTPTPRRLRRRA